MSFFKEFLTYSRRERNGIIALSVLILVLIMCRILIPYLPAKESKFDYSAFEKEIDAYQASVIPSGKTTATEIKSETILFKFDPNTVTSEDLSKLGLTEKQIRTILNYRNKGGKFRDKDDFKKIYGIRPEQFQALEPYIAIEPQENKAKTTFVKAESKKIELNSADSLSLLSLNGIGPAFASRIIKYRSALGGYYKLEQLKEVFGLDSILFNKIKNRLFVDASSIRKININKAEIGDLKRHPYLRDYQKCKIIVQYRNEHGRYSSIADLKKSIPGNEAFLEKINTYLDYSN
jgi:competence protein ComEA